MSEHLIRGSRLIRPFHGVRVSASSSAQAIADDETSLDAILRRVRLYVPLLRPGQYFSHLTAARLWQAPLPSALSDTEMLHVTATYPSGKPRTTGIIGHRSQPRAGLVTERYGLPVSTPADTWVALAPMISTADLVAVGDSLILVPAVRRRSDARPLTTVAELDAAIALSSGRGSMSAKLALKFVRQGAESRPETLLRILLWRAGFPTPVINANIYDQAGVWLGRADLSFPQWNTVVEYDGDQHRTNAYQYNKDIIRIENFERSGWNVVRIRKHGLFTDVRDTITRVERALRAHGWSR